MRIEIVLLERAGHELIGYVEIAGKPNAIARVVTRTRGVLGRDDDAASVRDLLRYAERHADAADSFRRRAAGYVPIDQHRSGHRALRPGPHLHADLAIAAGDRDRSGLQLGTLGGRFGQDRLDGPGWHTGWPCVADPSVHPRHRAIAGRARTG